MRLPLLLGVAGALLLTHAARARPPAAAGRVRILHQQGRWTGLGSLDALGGGMTHLFLISGELQNISGRPVGYVKLRFELLDATGKIVASEEGYNRKAEDLHRPDYEAGKVSRAQLHIRPLAPGTHDTFRMMFIRSEVPRFRHWRVRVVTVGAP